MLLSACSGDDEAPVAAGPAPPEPDNRAEVQAFYGERPEFFSYRSLADLPTDLVWENGAGLPDIGSSQATKGGTFHDVIADFPRTLRWVGPDATGSIRQYMIDDMAMFLAHPHPDHFDFHPGLAREWAVSPERKTVYVRLFEHASWSDGEPITSDDFFFMFFFFQSSYIREPWFNNWYGTQYTNITRYDDHTFSITVPEVKPDLDARVLSLTPIPEHFFRQLGDDYMERYQWQYWPSTGPYVIRQEDIKKGRSITLRRNENWWARDLKFWRNRFNPDAIVLTVIRDRAKTFEAFRRGDIDQLHLNTSAEWYEKLPDQDPAVASGYVHKSTFYFQHPMRTDGLYLNSSRAGLDQHELRLGIQHACNWKLVIDRVYRGDFRRLNTPNDGYGEFSHPGLRARDFDTGKAREYFAAAGYVDSGADGILVDAGGRRLSFTLTYGLDTDTDKLTVLKEEARKAGLELRLEKLDRTSAFKKVQEKKHDLYYGGFTPSLEMYPRYWEFQHSDNAYDRAFLNDGAINPERKPKVQTNNLEVIADTELDALIAMYRASSDRQEMIELAHRMDEMINEYGAWVPGVARDFYRLGHWRWVRYPKGFNLKHSLKADRYWVHWIDEALRDETSAAMREGRNYSPQINVYSQHRAP